MVVISNAIASLLEILGLRSLRIFKPARTGCGERGVRLRQQPAAHVLQPACEKQEHWKRVVPVTKPPHLQETDVWELGGYRGVLCHRVSINLSGLFFFSLL